MKGRAGVGALLLVPVVVLSACSGGAGGGGGASSKGATSTTRPAATSAAAAAAALGCVPFHGDTSRRRSVGPVSPGFLTDATAGAVGCLDQVTFTFDTGAGLDPPGYVVEYRDPAKAPFLDGDPPTAIDLPGSAFLSVTITPALSTNPLAAGNPQTYTGNLSLEYGEHHHLQIVRKLPDAASRAGSPDSVVWVIGLDGPRPFVVDRATNPARVTIFIG